MANEKIILKELDGRAIRFKDFGEGGNFGITLDSEFAEDLKENNWPVKYPKEPDSEGNYRPYMKVLIRYYNPKKRPVIYTVGSRGKSQIGQEDLGDLDALSFNKMSLILEKSWVEKHQCWSCYLVTGYFFIDENELDLLYSDIPDIGGPIIADEDEEYDPF